MSRLCSSIVWILVAALSLNIEVQSHTFLGGHDHHHHGAHDHHHHRHSAHDHHHHGAKTKRKIGTGAGASDIFDEYYDEEENGNGDNAGAEAASEAAVEDAMGPVDDAHALTAQRAQLTKSNGQNPVIVGGAAHFMMAASHAASDVAPVESVHHEKIQDIAAAITDSIPKNALVAGEAAASTPEKAQAGSVLSSSKDVHVARNGVASSPQQAPAAADSSPSSSSSNANAAATEVARSSFENADIAAADAVVSAQDDDTPDATINLRADVNHGVAADDFQKEAKEVEAEETEILADASGDERAAADDEEFEKSVGEDEGETIAKRHADTNESGNDAEAEDEQTQLAESTSEDAQENGDDTYASDVNDEANEIEGEDSKIENESLADEQADAELGAISPKEDDEDEQKLASVPTPTPNAAAFHLSDDSNKSRPLRGSAHFEKLKQTVTSGSAIDAMRKALGAVATKPASKVARDRQMGGPARAVTPGFAGSVLGSAGHIATALGPAVVADSESTSKHALLQRRHKGREVAEDFAEFGDGSDEARVDDEGNQHQAEAEDNSEVEPVVEEGDRGDKDLDDVERVIVSDQYGTEASDDAVGQPSREEPVQHSQKLEQLDDVEAAIASDEDAEDSSHSMQDDEGESDEH